MTAVTEPDGAIASIVDELVCVNAQLMKVLDSAVRCECRISLPCFLVLASLNHSSQGLMTMTELASRVSLSSSGTTRLVDRVEAGGLVERLGSRTDRRVSYVRITDTGRTVLQRAEPAYRTSLNSYMSGRLDLADLRDLERILAKLNGRHWSERFGGRGTETTQQLEQADGMTHGGNPAR